MEKNLGATPSGTTDEVIKSYVDGLWTRPAIAYVATGEATSSATYVDLTTTTDTVTITVPASGIILLTISAQILIGASAAAAVSFAMSGANTAAAGVTPPDDSLALSLRNSTAGTSVAVGQVGITFPLTGLTAGSTTFKLKYKSASGSCTFSFRRLTAVPL